MLALSALGPRIMVCGPSTSGKSTLAVALGQTLDLPVTHLDLLRHLPHTDWEQRPDAEFLRLHDEAIVGECWIIEGNYVRHYPQRLRRATGIILLGGNRLARLGRYAWRTLAQPDRAGSLAGGHDSLKREMVRWILVTSPRNHVRDRAVFRAAGLPLVELESMRSINQAYVAWGLSR